MSRATGQPCGPAVRVAVRQGIGWITLARPAARNALDAEVMAGLVEAREALDDDPSVRVVVLGGEGRDFCAGLPGHVAWPPRAWPDGVEAIAGIAQPVVACLTGAVRSWGLGLALACDIRLAATTAVLETPDVGLGRLPGGGVTQRLPRMAGASRGLAMLLLGERMTARQARAAGLVSHVVPPGRLAGAAAALARGLAARAPLALRFAKEAVVRALDLPLHDGVRLEHDLYVLLQTTADRREGVRSFLERRPPDYEGR